MDKYLKQSCDLAIEDIDWHFGTDPATVNYRRFLQYYWSGHLATVYRLLPPEGGDQRIDGHVYVGEQRTPDRRRQSWTRDHGLALLQVDNPPGFGLRDLTRQQAFSLLGDSDWHDYDPHRILFAAAHIRQEDFDDWKRASSLDRVFHAPSSEQGFDDPNWTIEQAVAWGIGRDEKLLDAAEPLDGLNKDDVHNAIEALFELLKQRKLTSSGIMDTEKVGARFRLEIKPEDWETGTFEQNGGRLNFCVENEGKLLTNILIERAGLITLWPARERWSRSYVDRVAPKIAYFHVDAVAEAGPSNFETILESLISRKIVETADGKVSVGELHELFDEGTPEGNFLSFWQVIDLLESTLGTPGGSTSAFDKIEAEYDASRFLPDEIGLHAPAAGLIKAHLAKIKPRKCPTTGLLSFPEMNLRKVMGVDVEIQRPGSLENPQRLNESDDQMSRYRQRQSKYGEIGGYSRRGPSDRSIERLKLIAELHKAGMSEKRIRSVAAERLEMEREAVHMLMRRYPKYWKGAQE